MILWDCFTICKHHQDLVELIVEGIFGNVTSGCLKSTNSSLNMCEFKSMLQSSARIKIKIIYSLVPPFLFLKHNFINNIHKSISGICEFQNHRR